MAKKTGTTEADSAATTQVNIAEFQRTRDSVIVALATLQSSVQDLSRAYINHANTVLGPSGGSALDSNLTDILSGSGLLSARTQADIGAAPAEAEAEGKKKRKRTPHDPNAPKRALTPYFLYMQSARATIARELGEQAKPKEVADEGTRRWTEMSPSEKSVWDDKYQKNLAAYRVKMAEYKAGRGIPTDEEAARLVAIGKVPEHVAGVDAEPESDDAEEEPAPVKAPEPKPAKRRKTKDATDVKETPKAPKSPEKEKKSGKKAKKEASPAPVATPAKGSEKKKKSKKAA